MANWRRSKRLDQMDDLRDVVLSWALLSYRRTPRALVSMLALAFICTFFPAWVRLFTSSTSRSA